MTKKRQNNDFQKRQFKYNEFLNNYKKTSKAQNQYKRGTTDKKHPQTDQKENIQTQNEHRNVEK